MRIAWIALLGCWLFLVLSLASFNAEAPPSHVVSHHNDPVANLCGWVGSTTAYWIKVSIGNGAWILLAGAGLALWVTAAGGRIGHPVVRFVGLVMMAISVSCLHALWFSGSGSLTGAEAGMLPMFLVDQLEQRFNGVGVSLILLVSLAMGTVVAIDQFVLALPGLIRKGLGSLEPLRKMKPHRFASRFKLANIPVLAGIGGRGGSIQHELDDEYEEEEDYDGEYEDEEEEYEDEDIDDEGYAEEDEYEEDEYEYEDEEEDEEEAPPQPRRARPAAQEPPRKLSSRELKDKMDKLPLRMSNQSTAVAKDEDIPRDEDYKGYQFPTLDLLEDPESNFSAKIEAIVRKQAQHLEEALHNYQIHAEVTGIESGPVVTLFSIQLAPGTRVARLQAISLDIARALGAQNIRILPNMEGKTTVGIEIPNKQKEKVRLKELMSGGHAKGMTLPMFLGKDSAGEPLVEDLTKMPHMLIAGSTNSGKSVCMNTIIMSWLYTKRPDELKLILVDPKMVEMNQFSQIPHLMTPVVTETARAAGILEWAVGKMEERYELFREVGVRNVSAYNELEEQDLYERLELTDEVEQAKVPKKLPLIVFVIDELADLMMTNKDVEHSIVRIAQKARAVGMHLILATQRPQANVVTGLIKSNMPSRCSFRVASGMDSRIVLDQKGAELLLGQGDMLFQSPEISEIRRAQGTLVTDGEIRKVAKFLKTVAGPSFERSLMKIRPGGGTSGDEDGEVSASERDPLFGKAVEIMIESGRGSVSLLQRRLAIGYSRASRLVDQMGLAGILGEHKGSVAREVMISLEDWQRMQAMEDGHEEEDLQDGMTEDQDEPVPAELEGEYLD